MNVYTKKNINMISSPFRAIYASVATVFWEVLTLGVCIPDSKFCWKSFYNAFKLDSKDNDIPNDCI